MIKTYIQWEQNFYLNNDSHRTLTDKSQRELSESSAWSESALSAVTVRGRSVPPSSCRPVSGSAPARFSLATWRGRQWPRGLGGLTVWLWRRTPWLRATSPTGWPWAACTCTLRRGRCRGRWPWRRQLQAVNRRLIQFRWLQVQMFT